MHKRLFCSVCQCRLTKAKTKLGIINLYFIVFVFMFLSLNAIIDDTLKMYIATTLP